jgi:actin
VSRNILLKMGKFNAKKCNMILKLAINRINIHKLKKIEISLQHKKEVADLLEKGKKEQAKITTRSIVYEDYAIETLHLVELYCGVIVQRMDILQISKHCPPELREAVCSIIYSAPYLENDAKFGEPELMKVRKMFLHKFGKSFVNECIKDQCINPKLTHNLSGTNPPDSLIEFYLNAIGNKNQDLHPLILLEASSPITIEENNLSSVNESVAIPFTSLSVSNEFPGTLIMDAANNAWVVDQNNENVTPMFIPSSELNGAQNGDIVVAEKIPRSDGKSIGKIIKVTSKAVLREVIQKLKIDEQQNYFVDDPQNIDKPIFIASQFLQGAEKGDKVKVVALPTWSKSAPVAGKIISILEKAPKEFKGVVMVDKKNHYWVIDQNNKQKPIYILPEDTNLALNGDLVSCILNPPRPDGNMTGKILNIIKRAQQPKEITARLMIDNKGHAWVLDSNDNNKPIYIPSSDLNDAKNNDLVLVRALPPNQNGQIIGKVISVLQKAPQPYEVTGILEQKDGKYWVYTQRSAALTEAQLKLNKSTLKPFNKGKDQKPILIDPKNLNGAMNGDVVQILAQPPLTEDGTIIGKVLEIIAKAAFRDSSKIKKKGKSSAIDWNLPSIVIDNGSGVIKAGFSGEEKPRVVFQSVVGRPMLSPVMISSDNNFLNNKIVYVGQEAISKRGLLKLSRPLEHGRVKDWDDLEAIWAHLFNNELKIDSTERPVLLTEPPRNPKNNKEQMQEIMFERFGVPALYVSIQAVLSLYSLGQTTGLVLDSGDGVTHTVPIYEGYTLEHAIGRIDLAGSNITEYLSTLLTERGLMFSSSSEKEIVRDMKERYAFVAENFNDEMKKKENEFEVTYTLPDGKNIKIGSERFRCTEALFQPSFLGLDLGGIQHLVFKSIMNCDTDVRSDLFDNVVLSGGNTCYKGFDTRLLKELNLLNNNKIKVNIKTQPQRQFSVWSGGSVLASLNSFRDNWITREEYDEIGPSIIHRKCF